MTFPLFFPELRWIDMAFNWRHKPIWTPVEPLVPYPVTWVLMQVQPNIGELLLRASGTFNGLPRHRWRFAFVRWGLQAMGESSGDYVYTASKIYLLQLPKMYPWNGASTGGLIFSSPTIGSDEQSMLVPMIINSMLFVRTVVPSDQYRKLSRFHSCNWARRRHICSWEILKFTISKSDGSKQWNLKPIVMWCQPLGWCGW